MGNLSTGLFEVEGRHYKVFPKCFHKGKYSTLYQVHDVKTKQVYCLKRVLLPNKLRDKAKPLLKEIELLSKLPKNKHLIDQIAFRRERTKKGDLDLAMLTEFIP